MYKRQLRYPCLDEGLPDRTAEIEHAGTPQVGPPELRAKTLHELLGDLVFVTEDMSCLPISKFQIYELYDLGKAKVRYFSRFIYPTGA